MRPAKPRLMQNRGFIVRYFWNRLAAAIAARPIDWRRYCVGVRQAMFFNSIGGCVDKPAQ